MDSAPKESNQTTEQTPVVHQPVQTPKTKKPLIIGAVIAAAVLLLIIVAVVLSLMSVSKSDYREALNKYDQLRTTNSTLSRKVSTLSYSITSATDTSFNNDVEAIGEGLDKIKAENEELGELKAVRIGEGAKVYKPFDEKIDAYLNYSGNLLESIKNIREPLVSCNDATKSVSSSSDRAAASAAIKVCTDKVAAIKNVPDADMKKFITAFSDSLKELGTVIDKSSAITDPYGAQYEEYKVLRDQTRDIQTKLRNTSKDLSSNLEKRDKETSPKEESEVLSKLLVEKSRS